MLVSVSRSTFVPERAAPTMMMGRNAKGCVMFLNVEAAPGATNGGGILSMRAGAVARQPPVEDADPSDQDGRFGQGVSGSDSGQFVVRD